MAAQHREQRRDVLCLGQRGRPLETPEAVVAAVNVLLDDHLIDLVGIQEVSVFKAGTGRASDPHRVFSHPLARRSGGIEGKADARHLQEAPLELGVRADGVLQRCVHLVPSQGDHDDLIDDGQNAHEVAVGQDAGGMNHIAPEIAAVQQRNVSVRGCAEDVGDEVAQVRLLGSNLGEAPLEIHHGAPDLLVELLLDLLVVHVDHLLAFGILLDAAGDLTLLHGQEIKLVGLLRVSDLVRLPCHRLDLDDGGSAEVRAGLHDRRPRDLAVERHVVMVVAAEDEVDLRNFVGEALVVGHAHVRERDDDVASLFVLQLVRPTAARLDEIRVVQRGRVHRPERRDPIVFHDADEADSRAFLLKDEVVGASAHGLLGRPVVAVGAQPGKVGLAHQVLHDVHAEVEVMVADAGDVDAEEVQHRRHLLSLGERGHRAGREGVPREQHQRVHPRGSHALDEAREARRAAHWLAGASLDVVHVVEVDDGDLLKLPLGSQASGQLARWLVPSEVNAEGLAVYHHLHQVLLGKQVACNRLLPHFLEQLQQLLQLLLLGLDSAELVIQLTLQCIEQRQFNVLGLLRQHLARASERDRSKNR
eukprot:scaffold111_cov252-Pinguiococcus_pyrenoidosus.AAC.25